MNPIASFEQAAKQICTTCDDPVEKAGRLMDLAGTIGSYLDRTRSARDASVALEDQWRRLATDRATHYLERLATDAKQMAATCRLQASVSR